jgi:glycosyltransferase involved in cell wall biosynthesis
MGKKLLVLGDGPELGRLQKLAGPTVAFAGRQEGGALAAAMQRCRALLFPGEEDFGITPVEALAAGRPVIAFGRGGVLETVRHGENGILFDAQNADALMQAMTLFESGGPRFASADLNRTALPFSGDRFAEQWRTFLAHRLHNEAAKTSKTDIPRPC